MTDDPQLSFTEHLSELRVRILRSLWGMTAAFVLCMPFAPQIRQILMRPLVAQLPPEMSKPVGISVISPLLLDLKLAFVAGIFLASPWLLYQLWAFIAPGLYPHERRLVAPFILAGSTCFIGGAAFAYFAVLPVMFGFLIHYMVSTGVTPVIDIKENLSVIALLLLTFGAVFEMPLLLVFLALLGLITRARLVAFRRYAVVLNFIVAAIVTPTTDALSLLMMAAPMTVLYEAGIIGVSLIERLRNKKADAAQALPNTAEAS